MAIIGEIRAFAFDGRSDAFGKACGAGWIPCDGRALAYYIWPELGEAIGTSWGSIDPEVNFCVPNLFGSFLRGASNWGNVATNDPEVLKRTPPRPELAVPGNSRMYVGSYQEDEIEHHTHKYLGRHSSVLGATEAIFTNGHQDGPYEGAIKEYGGSETRPKNHYVLYMIYSGREMPLNEVKKMIKSFMDND